MIQARCETWLISAGAYGAAATMAAVGVGLVTGALDILIGMVMAITGHTVMAGAIVAGGKSTCVVGNRRPPTEAQSTAQAFLGRRRRLRRRFLHQSNEMNSARIAGFIMSLALSDLVPQVW